MGYYINNLANGQPLPLKGKAEFLHVHVDGAIRLSYKIDIKDWDKDLVCVVENGAFDSACHVHSVEQLDYILSSWDRDTRPKAWLIVPGAGHISGYLQITPESMSKFESFMQNFKK